MIDKAYSELTTEVLTNMRRLALTSEKDEVQLKASLHVLEHFKESESRQPIAAIQINNNIGMPEIPVEHGTERRTLEIAGIKVAAPKKQRERKVVLAREEEWRTKSEKAVDSKKLELDPSSIGISPTSRVITVAERPYPVRPEPKSTTVLPTVKMIT